MLSDTDKPDKERPYLRYAVEIKGRRIARTESKGDAKKLSHWYSGAKVIDLAEECSPPS